MFKLAIVTTHPIQYNAPMFRQLANSSIVQPKIFYSWGKQVLKDKFDPGFGKTIEWDIPLLDGYEYEFVENVAREPGSHHFKGIDNPGLISSIKKWGADGVLVYGWSFKSHLAVLRHFKGKIPVYFRGDSTLLSESGALKATLRKLFLRWVYSYVDKAFYVGTHNKDYFIVHGLREHQLVYAPHAIDNERFSSLSSEQQRKVIQWRADLGFSSDDLVVLFVGKFDEVKQPQTLIQIARSIPNPRLKFLFVGNGLLEKSLKMYAEDDKRIRFLDFQNQSQMPLVYRLGDIFILPSKSETWGLAINEAMACGLAVIASNKCGGAVDLINQENGLIFNYADLSEVNRFLEKCLSQPVILNKMKRASLTKVERFGFSAIVAAIEATVKK